MTFALWLFRPITTILHTHGWEMLTLLFIASWSHVGRKNSIIIQHLSLWSHYFNLAIRTPFILHRPCRCPRQSANGHLESWPLRHRSLAKTNDDATLTTPSSDTTKFEQSDYAKKIISKITCRKVGWRSKLRNCIAHANAHISLSSSSLRPLKTRKLKSSNISSC